MRNYEKTLPGDKKNLPYTYQNVMESLVEDEIERQLKNLPTTLKPYINKLEIATYALNRLPPLYASSEKGKSEQKLQGQSKYKEQIKIAVRQGLSAVERDPLKTSRPLISELELKYQMAQEVLNDIEKMLKERELFGSYEKLSWENLVVTLQRVLNKLTSPTSL
jgi:hypothetical protein